MNEEIVKYIDNNNNNNNNKRRERFHSLKKRRGQMG